MASKRINKMGTLKKWAFVVVGEKYLKISLGSNMKGIKKKITLIILLSECQEFLKRNQTKPRIQSPLSQRDLGLI